MKSKRLALTMDLWQLLETEHGLLRMYESMGRDLKSKHIKGEISSVVKQKQLHIKSLEGLFVLLSKYLDRDLLVKKTKKPKKPKKKAAAAEKPKEEKKEEKKDVPFIKPPGL